MIHISVIPFRCSSGYCSSFYGRPIIGSNNSVAMACKTDPKCKAFRYSVTNGFGFLCDKTDQEGDYYDDWKLCKIR